MVRQGSAKAPFAGSIPASASLLSPARAPARLALAACAAVLAFAGACAKKAPPAPPHPLDVKNGFRDASFGLSPLKLTGIDIRQPLYHTEEKDFYKIYTRKNESLVVGDTHLEEIRYAFFKDQLAEINLLWNPEPRPGPARPPPIFGFLTNQFGPPTTHALDPKTREFRAVWQATKVRLTLTEVAPEERRAGQGAVTITSRILARQREAATSAAAKRNRTGF